MITRVRLLLLVIFSFGSLYLSGQARISGFVYKQQTKYPMDKVEVSIPELNFRTLTDQAGYFYFYDVPMGIYTLRISHVSFQTHEKKIIIDSRKEKLGNFYLVYDPEASFENRIPQTSMDNFLGADPTPDPNLLNLSPDLNDRMMQKEVGIYGFNRKGLSTQNQKILLNAAPIKGSALKENMIRLDGFQDLMKLSSNSVAQADAGKRQLGDTGGLIDWETHVSELNKGLAFSYGTDGVGFGNRYALRYNSGLSKKGWGLQLFGSRSTGDLLDTENTSRDAWAYHGAIEKNWKKHQIYLSYQGLKEENSPASLLPLGIIDLRGREYNPNFGTFGNENKSIGNTSQEAHWANMGHQFYIDSVQTLNSSFYYRNIRWTEDQIASYQKNNPLPTAFRNTPSYLRYLGHPESEISAFESEWRSNENVYRIDWKALQDENKVSPSYGIVDDVVEEEAYGFNIGYENEDFAKGKLEIHLFADRSQADFYAQVSDLLGADYFPNLDDFTAAGGGFDENQMNSELQAGDKYAYHYTLFNNEYALYTSYKKQLKKLEYAIAGQWKLRELSREGKFRNYLFSDDSFGSSTDYYLWDLGAKAHISHPLSKKIKLTWSSAWFSHAPEVQNIFPLQRISNLSLKERPNASRWYNEMRIHKNFGKFQWRIAPYLQYAWNQTQGDDVLYDLGLNEELERMAMGRTILWNVNTLHAGLELDWDYKIGRQLLLAYRGFFGDHRYVNKPDLKFYSTEFASQEGFQNQGSADIKNLRIGGYPQLVQHFSIQFNDRNNEWFVRLGASHLGGLYAPLSFLRYTPEFLSGETGIDQEILRQLRNQSTEEDIVVFNIHFGKAYKFKWFDLGLTLGMYNIFDSKGGLSNRQSTVIQNYGDGLNFRDDLDKLNANTLLNGRQFYLRTFIDF